VLYMFGTLLPIENICTNNVSENTAASEILYRPWLVVWNMLLNKDIWKLFFSSDLLYTSAKYSKDLGG